MSTINNAVNHSVTLGSGTYTNPLTVTSNGSVNNTGSGAGVYGPNSQAWTVVNDGTITASGNETLGNVGVVPADGIDLMAGGSAFNMGHITAAGNDVYITGGVGTVTNYGTMVASTEPGAYAYSVVLEGGGGVTNGNTLTFGSPSAASMGGIYISGGAGTVVNYGAISNSTGAGIVLAGGGTVRVDGLVSGGGGAYGIVFGGAGTNVLELHQAFTITGGVYAPSSASNTLYLTNPVAVQWNNTAGGQNFVNFQTAKFAAGTYGFFFPTELVIGNTANLPGTISQFKLFSDEIDLATFANGSVVNFSTVTHQLTIGNSGGTVVLQLDNEDYTGVSFHAGSDGSGGTEIRPSAPITGTVTGGIQLFTAEAFDENPLNINASGYVTNKYGTSAPAGAEYRSPIWGDAATSWTVNNAGTVKTQASAVSNAAISLAGGGTVNNSGTVSGIASGIKIAGSGAANNTGTVSGGITFGGNGVVTNGTGGVSAAMITQGIIIVGTGSVDNFARIDAGSGTRGAIFIFGPGTATNEQTGSINGYVRIAGSSAGFTNLGTVTGGATLGGGTLVNGAAGVTAALIGGAVTISGTGNSFLNRGTVVGGVQVNGVIDNFGSTGGIGVGSNSTVTNETGGMVNGGLSGISGGTGVAITNNASIAAQTGSGNYSGVQLVGGNVTNASSASITGGGGVEISGTGSVVNFGRIIGTTGPGQVGFGVSLGTGLLENYGTVEGNFKAVVGDSNGVTIVNGSLTDTTAAITNTATGGIYYAIETYGRATVTNFGSIIDAARAGIALRAGGTVIDAGLAEGGAGYYGIAFDGTGNNLLVLEHGYSIAGGVYLQGTANTVELLGSVGGPVAVDFTTLLYPTPFAHPQLAEILFGAGTNETLEIDNNQHLPAQIAGLTAGRGEYLDLTFIGDTQGTATATLMAGNTLVVTGDGGATVSLQLDPNQNFSGLTFTTKSDGGSGSGTDVGIACFARGTRILTATGEVAVEDLAIGDRVVTEAGWLRRVKWIGRRSYDGRFIAGNYEALPIVVKEGALGDGVPRRDLWLSPHHALWFQRSALAAPHPMPFPVGLPSARRRVAEAPGGVLVPVEHLVNGASIVQQRAVERVDYFHVELDSHDVLLAEGAPAESFVDCDSRLMFHNAAEFADLYPADPAAGWEFCAPRLSDEPEVEALWRRLALRAGITVAAGPLHGWLDAADGGLVRGWARDPAQPDRPVLVEVLVDGAAIGRTLANRYRPDLATAGYGHGRHGFEFPVPAADRQKPVAVRRADDGAELPRSWAWPEAASM